MALVDLIIWLVIGGVAGWLAGLIVAGYGFGLVGNVVVGIVGALIAGWLLPRIGFVLIGGTIAAIVNAVIGAVILLVVVGFFRRAAA
ncbi:MAG: GlsB/YeaQ/YmgE family stress response membrane protein [Pseudolabrys sp.]